MSSANPPSPKVIFAAAAAFIVPVIVAGVLALISFLLTDSGRELFRDIPLWVRIPLWAMLAAAGAIIAGYQKRDPIRDDGLRMRGINPDAPARRNEL